MIHSTALVHSSAKLAENVKVGAWSIIGENVELNDGVVVGPHVTIEKNTRVGKNTRIVQYASVGSDPQDVSYKSGEETWLDIGENNIIREFVTINRGTLAGKGQGKTLIGDNNYLMAYVHVAHDCEIGDHVIFANNASVAGHVTIDDHVILGAFTGIHQFVNVGRYSFLGRATKIVQDILPYMLVTGNPGVLTGLNSVGLKRAGFPSSALRELKKAHQLIVSKAKKLVDIRAELLEMSESTPEIKLLVDAIDNSERGIAR